MIELATVAYLASITSAVVNTFVVGSNWYNSDGEGEKNRIIADRSREKLEFEINKLKMSTKELREDAIRMAVLASEALNGHYPLYKVAEQYLKQALDEWDRNTDMHELLDIQEKANDKCVHANIFLFSGLMCYKNKNYPEAITALENSYKLNPYSITTILMLGLVYFEQKEEKRALYYFLIITIQIEEKHPIANIFIALIQNDETKFNQYINDFFIFQRTEKIDDDFTPIVCHAYGNHLLEKKNFVDALSYLTDGINSIKSGSPAKQHRLKELLIQLYLLRGHCFDNLSNDIATKPSENPTIEQFFSGFYQIQKPLTYFALNVFDEIDARTSKTLENCNFPAMVERLKTDKNENIAKFLGAHINGLLDKGIFFTDPRVDASIKILIREYHEIRKHRNQSIKYLKELELHPQKNKNEIAAQNEVVANCEKQLQAFALREEVKEYLIKYHLKNKGWKPWFLCHENPRSYNLLDVVAHYNDLDLFIYEKQKENNYQLTVSRTYKFKATLEGSKILVDKSRSLHVILTQEKGRFIFRILNYMDATSTKCKHMAQQDFRRVYDLDSEEFYPLKFLAKREITSAQIKLADKYATIGSYYESYILYKKVIQKDYHAAEEKLAKVFENALHRAKVLMDIVISNLTHVVEDNSSLNEDDSGTSDNDDNSIQTIQNSSEDFRENFLELSELFLIFQINSKSILECVDNTKQNQKELITLWNEKIWQIENLSHIFLNDLIDVLLKDKNYLYAEICLKKALLEVPNNKFKLDLACIYLSNANKSSLNLEEAKNLLNSINEHFYKNVSLTQGKGLMLKANAMLTNALLKLFQLVGAYPINSETSKSIASILEHINRSSTILAIRRQDINLEIERAANKIERAENEIELNKPYYSAATLLLDFIEWWNTFPKNNDQPFNYDYFRTVITDLKDLSYQHQIMIHQWLKDACKQNIPKAKFVYSIVNEQGLFGTKNDPTQAKKLMEEFKEIFRRNSIFERPTKQNSSFARFFSWREPTTSNFPQLPLTNEINLHVSNNINS